MMTRYYNHILLLLLYIGSGIIGCVGLTAITCPTSYVQLNQVIVSSYTTLNCAIQAKIPTIFINQSVTFPQEIVVPPNSRLSISSLQSGGRYNAISLALTATTENSRLFNISDGSNVTFNSLYLIGNRKLVPPPTTTAVQTSVGGIIYVTRSVVTFVNSSLTYGFAACGSAIYATNQASVAIKSSKIADNSDMTVGECYGAVTILSHSNVTVTHSVLSDNIAYSAGALYVSSGYVTVDSSTFTNNRATVTDGGGILITGPSSTAVMRGNIFNGNVAGRNGGGIITDNNAVTTLIGNTFHSNKAISRGGSIFTMNSIVKVSQCTFSNSTVSSRPSSDSGKSGRGGAIYINGGTASITDASFYNGSALSGAGIFCTNAASVSVSGSTQFTDNLAHLSGGAIAVTNKCLVTLTQSSLTHNIAIKSLAPTAFGGGISCQDAYITASSVVISDGSATQGAAIYAVDCDVTLTAMSLYNHIAEISAIYSTRSKLDVYNSMITNTSSTVEASAITCLHDSECKIINTTFAHNYGLYIGTVQITESQATIANCQFFNNTGLGYGGAVYIFESSMTQISNCSFTANQAHNAYGGAIAVVQLSTVQITHSTFHGNTAVSGGAIYATDECDITLTDITFTGNQAFASGGALYIDDFTDVTCDTIVIQNSISPTGGGVYIGYASTFILHNFYATGNMAGDNGGVFAIFDVVTLYLNNATMTGNRAALGGAISVQYLSTVTLQSCIVDQNQAHGYGGALYVMIDSQAIVKNTKLTGNSASYGGGAGYAVASVIQVYDSSFVSHTASNGGVFSAIDSLVTLDDSMFSKNGGKAMYGGVFYLASESEFRSTGNHFMSNQAAYGGSIASIQSTYVSTSDMFSDCIGDTGGCIYSSINTTLHIDNGIFTKNRASVATTGVIYISSGAMIMSNTIISQNTVKRQGSLSLFSVYAKIYNSTFIDNAADGETTTSSEFAEVALSTSPDAGAVYIACRSPCSDLEGVDTFSTIIVNSTFIGNIAANGFGGGIFVDSYPGYVNISNTHFHGNIALNGGGIGVRYSDVDIENSVFNDNIAYEGGGGVFWFYSTESPTTFTNIQNSGNIAAYGPLRATNLVALNSTFDATNLQISGQQLTTPINVTLLDYYGQIVRNSSLYNDASTTIYCSVNENSGIIKGKTIVPSRLGVATFSQLILTGVPGGVTTLRFTFSTAEIGDHLQEVRYRQCVSGEITVNLDEGLSSCEKCGLGTYSLNPSDSECTICPEHVQCPGGDVLDLDRDYWRISQTSTSILACPFPGLCLGGTNTSTQCAEGQKGPYCTVCDDGYTKGSSGACYSCGNPADLFLELLSTLLFVTAVIVIYILYKKRRKIIAWYAKTINARMQNRTVKSFRVKAKIVVSFCQIIFQMGPAFNLVFPPIFTSYLNHYSIFQLNLLLIPNVNCLVQANYYVTLIATTVSPPIFFLFIALFLQCRVIYARIQNSKNPAYKTRKAKKDTITIGFLISYFVLVNVSTKILEVFQCETFDNGSSYLVADYSINCDDPDRALYIIYAIVMIFVYPVGIPLVYGIILFRNRNLVNPSSTLVVSKSESLVVNNRLIQRSKIKIRSTYESIRNIKNLYESYTPKRWYFELFDCARRLCLGAIPVLIFRGSTLQIIVVLLVSLASVCIFMYQTPYIHRQDNNLAIIAQWSITLVVISAMVIKVQAVQPTKQNSNGLGAVLIILNVIVIAFSLAAAVIGSKVDEEEGDEDDPTAVVTTMLGIDEEEEEDEEGKDKKEGDDDEEESSSEEDGDEDKKEKKTSKEEESDSDDEEEEEDEGQKEKSEQTNKHVSVSKRALPPLPRPQVTSSTKRTVSRTINEEEEEEGGDEVSTMDAIKQQRNLSLQRFGSKRMVPPPPPASQRFRNPVNASNEVEMGTMGGNNQRLPITASRRIGGNSGSITSVSSSRMMSTRGIQSSSSGENDDDSPQVVVNPMRSGNTTASTRITSSNQKR